MAPSKLVLSKETLRAISGHEAGAIAGGLTMTCHLSQCNGGCLEDPPAPGTLSGRWCSFPTNCQTLFSYCGTC